MGRPWPGWPGRPTWLQAPGTSAHARHIRSDRVPRLRTNRSHGSRLTRCSVPWVATSVTASVFEIRIHGRGGQGVVTAAELLALAAFREDRYAQAFPSFGSERTGAPVVSFCRIDQRPIRTREPIVAPDALIVIDPTLLHQVDLFAGLKPAARVLINSSRELESLGLGELRDRLPAGRVATVAATDLARAHLGRPLPNAAMLGAFAVFTGAVTVPAVLRAIRERFPGPLAEANAAAALAAAGEMGMRPAALEAPHA